MNRGKTWDIDCNFDVTYSLNTAFGRRYFMTWLTVDLKQQATLQCDRADVPTDTLTSSHHIYSTDLWRLQDFIGICSSSFVDCYKRISHIHAPIPSVKSPAYSKYLLERNETGRVGGTNTGSSVLDWVAVGTLALSLLRPKLLPERVRTKRSRILPSSVRPSQA